jgi:hypothetical protein
MLYLCSHPKKQVVFALLSAADLALTWSLLGNSHGEVYEANPIARLWLTRFGWLGLAGFKAALVLLVLSLVVVIGRWRPRAAGRLLGFGCVCLAIVVSYSVALHLLTVRASEDLAAEIAQRWGDPGPSLNRPLRPRHPKFWPSRTMRLPAKNGLADDHANQPDGASSSFQRPSVETKVIVRHLDEPPQKISPTH